ncbi:hypothetical protein I4J33_11620 [Corynebacterium belfantii]|uniref:hypothetical protein n=1 Tax=Corynebacterium belfantii TaxID=2014537 RepID=UPI0018D2A087|nr:hypothetical protein [Corynebacterium belfantii]MBG9327033.1 hypothetical protein [Corynebacterium belfantii]
MARLVLEPVVQELVLAQAVAVVLACSAFPVRLGAGLLRVSRRALSSASSSVSCLACSASLSYSFWCAASVALTRVS